MSFESENKEPGPQWRADKSFFESNPRSKEIRNVSVIIYKKLHRLMGDPSLATDKKEESQLYSDIEKLSGKLVELGIKPHMHVGKPPSTFQADPVLSAEYVAGQILDFTGRNLTTLNDALPILEEHNELDSKNEGMLYMKTANLPKKARDMIVERQMITAMRNFLDVEPDDE